MTHDTETEAWKTAHLHDSHLFEHRQVDRTFFIKHMRSPIIATIIALGKTQRRKLRILEIGSGDGFDSVSLALRGHQVTSLDISEHALAAGLSLAEQARRLFPKRQLQIEFVPGDVFNLQAFAGQFDLVISINVIVIWSDQAKRLRMLSNIHSALKEDGWTLISTTNTAHPLLKYIPLKRIAHGVKGYTLTYLEAELNKAGFIAVKRGAVGLSPNFEQWLAHATFSIPLKIANFLFNLLPQTLQLAAAPNYYVLASKRRTSHT